MEVEGPLLAQTGGVRGWEMGILFVWLFSRCMIRLLKVKNFSKEARLMLRFITYLSTLAAEMGESDSLFRTE